MPYIIIFFICFIAAISFYIFKLIKRVCNALNIDTSKILIKTIIVAFSVIFGVMSTNVFTFWAIMILHFVFISLIIDFINAIIKVTVKNKSGKAFSNWKKLHSLCIIPLVIAIAVMCYGHINLYNVQKTNYTVHTTKNIKNSGYRVALLADIHYGVSLDKEGLLKVCENVSNENADVVILCGDITDDDTTKEQMEEVYAALGTIKSRYGTYYVYGNHDRQQYRKSRHYSEATLKKAIEKNNITILQDEKSEITYDFVIIGREDASLGRMPGSNTTSQRKSIEDFYNIGDDYRSSFVMVLDHQPKELTKNASYGVDLTVSGHTHGGQIWPVNIIDGIVKFNEVNYGQVHISDTSDAIVTSGVAGWKYPIKTAAPSEYVIIDITKK